MTQPLNRRHTVRHRVIEHSWIPLPDGTRLAARIWMPDGADAKPVPAILEYLPYRKRDGTGQRDESSYPVFADAGYAGVRVDIRGNGESDGLFDDEYSPRELADGLAVIAWIARQPWCSGAVGMMGISWGGFNAVQIAALKPPALKAVISLSTTVDRFNDDIHYKGGALLSANLAWASTMLCYASRPPDPVLVGDGWRQQWLERLENLPLLLETWLSRQTRDAYWQHGSICEDWGAIEAPTLVFGGWADGYRNAPSAAVANMHAPVKAVVGPWIHKYPHFAWPKPRADFHGLALAWWDRWLKGIENGAEAWPDYRAYITEGIRPAPERLFDPGRWIAEETWPSPNVQPQTWTFTDQGALTRSAAQAVQTMTIRSPQDCGVMAGEYFTLSPKGDPAADQRRDDAGSLVFETPVLVDAMQVLGRPQVTVRVAIDQSIGTLIVRLVDVLPDGMAHRVSFGVLNLTHRRDQAAPSAMIPGQAETVTVVLDECGHRFRAGHRLRLAISTSYWPMVLPPPAAFTATIDLSGSALIVPILETATAIDMPEPADPDPLPRYPQASPAQNERTVQTDFGSGRTQYRLMDDTGAQEIPVADGLIARERKEEIYTISPDDPLSATSTCCWLAERRRGDWSVRTVSATTLTADATHFHISAQLEAFDGAEQVFARDWQRSIPRRLL
jgi:uncharacterized protein